MVSICSFNGIVVNDSVDNEIVDVNWFNGSVEYGAQAVRSATSRWVSGEDFFDRESELEVLESRVRDGNHVLLTGQRRMGKTSVAQELGRRLESQGWVFLFTDVHGATCPEDVIACIAAAAHPVRPLVSGTFTRMRRWLTGTLDVLVHDGCLEPGGDGHRFPSRLLKDWWSARFRHHHSPLRRRVAVEDRRGPQ